MLNEWLRLVEPKIKINLHFSPDMVKEMTVKNLLSPLTPSGIKKKFKGLFYFVFEFRRVVNLSR